MALNLADKKRIVAELSDVIGNAVSIVAADYRGLSVADMDELRTEMRNAGVTLRVVRNTLTRIALKDTAYEDMQDLMTGPILLAFSDEDPASSARVFKAFIKGHENVEIRAISIEGKSIDPKALGQVADLPTKEQSISMLLSVLQAPMTKVALSLNDINTKLVRTIAAVGDSKQ